MNKLLTPNNPNTDDEIGELLRAAVSHRVDHVLTTEASTTSATAIARAAKKSKTRKRTYFALGTLTFGALGTTGAVQMASRETKTPTQISNVSSSTDIPQYLLPASTGFEQIYFSSIPNLAIMGMIVPVTGPKDERFEISSPAAIPHSGAVTDVVIGSSKGQWYTNRSFDWWGIEWTIGERTVSAQGSGQPSAELIAALGSITYDPSRGIATINANGFSAGAPYSPTALYSVTYQTVPQRIGAELTVFPQGNDSALRIDPASAQIQRGTRKYLVEKGRSFSSDLQMIDRANLKDRTTTGVVWKDPSGYVIRFSVEATQDQALDLADQIRQATDEEWKKATKPRVFDAAMVLDGAIGKTTWVLQAGQRTVDTTCQPFELKWSDKLVSTCVPVTASPTSATFRALKMANVADANIVFGALPSGEDPRVIRVMDANGSLLAQDLTVEDSTTDGQVFAIALPSTAKNITVEIHEFDVDWFQQADENNTTDKETSLLNPDSKALTSKQVAVEPETK